MSTWTVTPEEAEFMAAHRAYLARREERLRLRFGVVLYGEGRREQPRNLIPPPAAAPPRPGVQHCTSCGLLMVYGQAHHCRVTS